MQYVNTRVLVPFLLLLASTFSFGQGPCPTASSTQSTGTPRLSADLICGVPQLYGPGGLVGTDHGGPLLSTAQFSHAAHFSNSSLQSFSSLNAEIGTQVSQLPLTAPISGFTFSFNPSLGVVSRQTESFGPILTERADTIGRHKLFVGASYQYFNFDKVDGVDLRNFGVVFRHEDEANLCPNPRLTCVGGKPLFDQDIIATQNRIDLKVHQFAAVATFGVTNRFDLSIAIPVLDVRMGMNSSAVVHSFETSTSKPACCVHQFDGTSGGIPGRETLISPAQANFFEQSSASGIGDIILRGKYEVLKGEKAGLALGLDVHFPTGDEKNFMGSGAWGGRPFVTFSYDGRISPHASFGYQRNSASILAGDITTNSKAHLPDIVTYSAGVDAGLTHRLSASLDYIGQSLIDARKIAATSFTDFGGASHPDVVTSSNTINQSYVSVGAKVNPAGKLLVIANVLFQTNQAGLHAKPVPLIGLSYTF
jgi:Putative MetA-pathway of phenol degradation